MVIDFSQKYKGAIIFLVLLLVITIILVFVYLMLKRGFSCLCCGCCPCCRKKKSDEEEGLYDEDLDDEIDDETVETNGDVPHDEYGNSIIAEDELPPPDIPEIMVTESEFKPEKKSKTLSGMFKKIKKVKGRVRFSSTTEKVAILPDHGPPQQYGSMGLAPLSRSDSMESFMSAMSTATTNVEEFGDELSPSRVQVFVQYDPKLWTLTVGIKQAECLVSTNKETMYWQTHMTLMPFKKHRFKTKYKSTSTPIFNQNFEIENIAQQALTQLSVRYRIYGRAGHTGRKKLAGETEVELSHICQMDDKIIKDWRVLRRAGGPAVRHESEV